MSTATDPTGLYANYGKKSNEVAFNSNYRYTMLDKYVADNYYTKYKKEKLTLTNPTTSSWNHMRYSDATPGLAIDGDTGTYIHTSSGQGSTQWFKADFPESMVTEVRVFNSNNDAGRLSNSRVYINGVRCQTSDVSMPDEAWYSYHCNVVGNKIRFDGPGEDPVDFGEIEVYKTSDTLFMEDAAREAIRTAAFQTFDEKTFLDITDSQVRNIENT